MQTRFLWLCVDVSTTSTIVAVGLRPSNCSLSVCDCQHPSTFYCCCYGYLWVGTHPNVIAVQIHSKFYGYCKCSFCGFCRGSAEHVTYYAKTRNTYFVRKMGPAFRHAVCIYAYVYISICICTCTCISIHMYVYMYVYMYKYLYLYMYICVYVYVFTRTHTYIRAYVHVHTCVHTHTHANTCKRAYMCTCIHACLHLRTGLRAWPLHTYLHGCTVAYEHTCMHEFGSLGGNPVRQRLFVTGSIN